MGKGKLGQKYSEKPDWISLAIVKYWLYFSRDHDRAFPGHVTNERKTLIAKFIAIVKMFNIVIW